MIAKTFKVIFITILFGINSLNMNAQSKEIIYPVVIKFQSECCGVPSDSTLKKIISDFKKKQKIRKMHACRIGPMGREGEYYIAFPLKELDANQSITFIALLQDGVKLMKDPGSADLELDMKVNPDDYQRAVFSKAIF